MTPALHDLIAAVLAYKIWYDGFATQELFHWDQLRQAQRTDFQAGQLAIEALRSPLPSEEDVLAVYLEYVVLEKYADRFDRDATLAKTRSHLEWAQYWSKPGATGYIFSSGQADKRIAHQAAVQAIQHGLSKQDGSFDRFSYGGPGSSVTRMVHRSKNPISTLPFFLKTRPHILIRPDLNTLGYMDNGSASLHADRLTPMQILSVGGPEA